MFISILLRKFSSSFFFPLSFLSDTFEQNGFRLRKVVPNRHFLVTGGSTDLSENWAYCELLAVCRGRHWICRSRISFRRPLSGVLPDFIVNYQQCETYEYT